MLLATLRRPLHISVDLKDHAERATMHYGDTSVDSLVVAYFAAILHRDLWLTRTCGYTVVFHITVSSCGLESVKGKAWTTAAVQQSPTQVEIATHDVQS